VHGCKFHNRAVLGCYSRCRASRQADGQGAVRAPVNPRINSLASKAQLRRPTLTCWRMPSLVSRKMNSFVV
jgi:hypothetical protein